MDADVIVVGLGSMGAATVAELAFRGVHVIGLDRFTPPHDRGAHSGATRIIRMAYKEGRDYVPLLRRAYELWRRIEVDSGVQLLTTTGALMLGVEDDKVIAGALATARAQGLPYEMLSAADIRRRFPAFTPADNEVGLFEKIAGLLRPELAITSLLAKATAAGADLRTGVGVLDWAAGSEGATVMTAGGTLRAGALVLAPGAWAPELTRLPGLPMRVERRVQHFWRPTDPELFEPGRLPAWIWGNGKEEAYGMPAVDGLAKVAMHRTAGPPMETVDPWVGAAPPRPQEVATMRDWLRGHMPALAAAEWLGSRPCHYTLTPDEHFLLGLHPNYPGVSVACGFSGHGFKFVPVVGEVLADLALTGATRHPIGLFAPGRFGPPVASAV